MASRVQTSPFGSGATQTPPWQKLPAAQALSPAHVVGQEGDTPSQR